jgi:hypothetical protein
MMFILRVSSLLSLSDWKNHLRVNAFYKYFYSSTLFFKLELELNQMLKIKRFWYEDTNKIVINNYLDFIVDL